MAFTRVAALLHAALSDVATDDHHTATVAGDLALADLATRAHADLSDSPAAAHHAKYLDSEAEAAIEAKSALNIQGQINFPDVQSASADVNTLDDYEEGTWTPVLTFATAGNLAVVYTVQLGGYQKVGNTVRLWFTIITSTFTHTTASGDCRITGLPFTVVNVGDNNGFGGGSWSGITNATYAQIVAYGVASVAYAQLRGSATAVAVAEIDVGDMPTGGTVALHGIMEYRV